MADLGTIKYDGQKWGNILVLGSTGSVKNTLVQELACNYMFGNIEGVHWISKVQQSKLRENEIDFCVSPKVEFYSPQDEYNLNNLENIH